MRYTYTSADGMIIEGHLRDMAEYYGRAVPSANVLSRWIAQLSEEVPPHCAATALADWTKRRDNYPTIAFVLKEARAIKEREDERKAENVRSDPSIPKVSDVRPYNPEMAEAVARCLKAINSMPPRPREFWEWEGIVALDKIGLLKRRYLEEKYGERLQNPAFINSIREKVRARLQLEAAIPKPSDFVAPVQRDAWEFGA